MRRRISALVMLSLLSLVGCTTLAIQTTPAVSPTLTPPTTSTSTAFVPTLPPTPTSPTTPTPTVSLTPTRRANAVNGNEQANAASGIPTDLPPGISADGRWVVFGSYASNLVPGDTGHCDSQWSKPEKGNCLDVFVRDRHTGTTRRVSVASDGTQANGESFAPAISADGRWVAFRSRASNLDASFAEVCAGRDFPHNCSGIYVHDLETGQTQLLAVISDNGGLGANDYLGISANGHFVSFWSYESRLLEGLDELNGGLFVYDRQTDELKLALQGGRSTGTSCQRPEPQTAAAWVAFSCEPASVFVYQRQPDQVTWVSASDGNRSADGQFAVFASEDDSLVPNDTQECDAIQRGLHNCTDVFVYDQQTGETERISLAADGSQGNGDSSHPSLSADGRLVAFMSNASNLVSGDTETCGGGSGPPYVYNCFDIFVYDRQSGTTERVSVASDGAQANDNSRWPKVSADGRWVVFVSWADNLVAGDTNAVQDVFAHDRLTGITERVSVPSSE